MRGGRGREVGWEWNWRENFGVGNE
jgi:hypothetical protein